MNVAVWSVVRWNPVFATVNELARQVESMKLLGASVQVSDEPEHAGMKFGQVLWGTETNEGRIGIAWDWAEVRRDVLALTDPMQIISNVVLVDDEGSCLDEVSNVVELNNAVYRLRWDEELRRRCATAPNQLAA